MSERIIWQIILGVLVFVYLFPIVVSVIPDRYFKKFTKKVLCDIFPWHNGRGDSPHYKEGDLLLVNLSSTCSRCGKSVMQDSQGNWF